MVRHGVYRRFRVGFDTTRFGPKALAGIERFYQVKAETSIV
jgi:hypothetical protein